VVPTATCHKNFEDLCQAIAKVIAAELGYKKKVTTASKSSSKAKSYYRSGTGLYRIKKDCYAYKSVKFDKDKHVEVCRKGFKFTIVDIVKYSSAYRLKTKSGLYITANKEFVEKV
jgi:N-acetylmuramoyl-L-alanine amidase